MDDVPSLQISPRKRRQAKPPTAEWFCLAEYLDRCEAFLSQFDRENDFTLLPHAGLELRFAIEDLLRHYLYLAQFGGRKRDVDFSKLYSATDLRRAILASDALIFVKLEFIDHLWANAERVTDVTVPQLEFICQSYGRLGNILHIQRARSARSLRWWLNQAEMIRQCHRHLAAVVSKPLITFSWNANDATLLAYQRGEISKTTALKAICEKNGLINSGVATMDLR